VDSKFEGQDVVCSCLTVCKLTAKEDGALSCCKASTSCF